MEINPSPNNYFQNILCRLMLMSFSIICHVYETSNSRLPRLRGLMQIIIMNGTDSSLLKHALHLLTTQCIIALLLDVMTPTCHQTSHARTRDIGHTYMIWKRNNFLTAAIKIIIGIQSASGSINASHNLIRVART